MKESIVAITLLILGGIVGYNLALSKVVNIAHDKHLVTVTNDGNVVVCSIKKASFLASDNF